MPHTRAWDETTPAGSELVSSADNTMRAMKADDRERMEMDHIWGTSQDHDGKHKRLRFRPDNDITEILTDNAASTTGSGTAGFIDHARTYNTTGVVNHIKMSVTKTAVGAGSKLWTYLVDAAEKFYITIDGVFTKLMLQSYREVYATPSISSGTLTLDYNTANVFVVDVNANITTVTFSNFPTAHKGSIEVWFKGNGTTYTQAWGSIRWPGDAAPTLTTTNGDYTIVTFHSFDNTTFFGIPAVSGL